MNNKKFTPQNRYLSLKKVEEVAPTNQNLFETKEEEEYGEYIVLKYGDFCEYEYEPNTVVLAHNAMVEKYKDCLFVLENYVVGTYEDESVVE